jgi:nitrous oxide reductase accessory protein NosL
MKSVCAWCQIDLGERPGPEEKITHGICEPCKSRIMADIDAATKPEDKPEDFAGTCQR